MTTCSNCGVPNPPEQKFCGECGTSLGTACTSCGTQNPPEQKFCGECGATLAAELAPTVATSTPVRGAPAADVPALVDLVQRLARLGLDVPAVAELDLNPVLGLPDRCIAVDARVRIQRPATHTHMKTW